MNSTPKKLSMMPTEKEVETQKDCNIGAHLFANEDDSFANEFVDKVRAIHEYFDKDNDGFLNFKELSSLQLCTSGKVMDGDIYAMVCRSLGCHPNRGMSLETLKLTYAAEGTDVGEFEHLLYLNISNVLFSKSLNGKR